MVCWDRCQTEIVRRVGDEEKKKQQKLKLQSELPHFPGSHPLPTHFEGSIIFTYS